MGEPDNHQDMDGDEQDQAEAFDEDNFDAANPGFDVADFKTFEEIPQVLDVTAREGDSDDDDALIGEDLDDDDIIEIELDSEEADDDAELAAQDVDEGGELNLKGEVDLVDAGDMRNTSTRAAKEGRSFESSRLDDDDIEDLGYGADGADGAIGKASPVRAR